MEIVPLAKSFDIVGRLVSTGGYTQCTWGFG